MYKLYFNEKVHRFHKDLHNYQDINNQQYKDI